MSFLTPLIETIKQSVQPATIVQNEKVYQLDANKQYSFLTTTKTPEPVQLGSLSALIRTAKRLQGKVNFIVVVNEDLRILIQDHHSGEWIDSYRFSSYLWGVNTKGEIDSFYQHLIKQFQETEERNQLIVLCNSLKLSEVSHSTTGIAKARFTSSLVSPSGNEEIIKNKWNLVLRGGFLEIPLASLEAEFFFDVVATQGKLQYSLELLDSERVSERYCELVCAYLISKGLPEELIA